MRYEIQFHFVGKTDPLTGSAKTKAEAKQIAAELAPKEERGGAHNQVKLITLTDNANGKQDDIYCYHSEVMRKAMKALP